jgi:hypothetical protein
MSLHYRQQYKLRLIETRLLRSDPRLAGMLGMFGRLAVGQAMPSWEQMSSRKDGIRQAAALLAEAVTGVAAALRVLLSSALAFVTTVVCCARTWPSALPHSRARPVTPQRGRTR